jgi:predicted SAM-dependent methyltransferase
MNKKCPICASKSLSQTRYRYGWSVFFQKKTIQYCRECGFGWMEPKVEQSKLIDFYETVYRSNGSPHYADFSSKIPAPKHYRSRSIAQILLAIQYLEHKSTYNILDVGAGLGRFFISAREIIKGDLHLFAVEHNKDAVAYFQKHMPFLNIRSDLSQFRENIDFALLSHSLEHFDIDDMPKLFDDLFNALSTNGVALVEVPNSDFRDLEYQKIRPVDTPHLSFFSIESLRLMLEQQSFEICFIETAGAPIEELDCLAEEATSKQVSSFKRKLEKLFIYRFIRKIKRRAVLECVSLTKSVGGFYKSSAFQYRGRRQVLRCVLRKKTI